MRSLTLQAVLACLLAAPAIGGEPPFHEPNAVLINITEQDLNRIVQDAFRANGVSKLEGAKQRISKGISDFSYNAGLSDPVLTLGDDGFAALDIEIRDAELTIGSIERKLLNRRMRCENAGVSVEPNQPVDVRLAMRFVVEDHDLKIAPEVVTLANTKGFRLRRPSSCQRNPLPEFLLWWIGKGRLRREIEKLDDLLLTKARDGAAALNAEEGLLTRQWEVGEDADPVFVYPHAVDTAHGSLLIALAGSSPTRPVVAAGTPAWVAARSAQSFLGLSESFLNFALQKAFHEIEARPRTPSGGLSKLFKSDAIYTLIPGLRAMDSRNTLRVGFAFHSAPRIEFDSMALSGTRKAAGRAVIRVRLSAGEMVLSEADGDVDHWLGSVDVDSAVISVAPYHNTLGGISFDVVENDWRLSSRGIEFDEEVLAATFQEMLFGELFETRFEPLGRETFDVGTTRFDPRYFSRIGGYLVIGLAAF